MIAQAKPKQLAAFLRTDFYAFAQKCFHHLNPGARLSRNWHQEAICYQLERLVRGEVTRLIVNAPPRSLKSQIVSVALPAWVLGLQPTARFICASYSQDLANKHANDFRKIAQSQWYRAMFPSVAPLKDSEAEYQTAQGGFRLATSVGGTLTGRGADYVIVDDPLSAADAYSKANRDRVNEWFPGTLLSRLDDKRSGRIVAVMQRLHQDDLTGFLLSQGRWDHLNLPAVTFVDRSVQLSRLHGYEWRAGEPLDAVREPLHVLELSQDAAGSINYAGQYLQDPIAPGGNMLKREWLRDQFSSDAPIRRPDCPELGHRDEIDGRQ